MNYVTFNFFLLNLIKFSKKKITKFILKVITFYDIVNSGQ